MPQFLFYQRQTAELLAEVMRHWAAEAEAKPKTKPLAKPKPKPQPQAEHPHPPLPPPHPLAAKKSAKAVKAEEMEEEEEEDEVESPRGEVQSLSTSVGAQRGAKDRAEAKVDALRAQGEEKREGWAAANLEKARQKVKMKEKEDNMCRPERRIGSMVEIVAKEAQVNKEVVDEVVEVEVEETVQDLI